MTWGSTTYIKKMLAQYEQLFGTEIPKCQIHTPLEPGDHPKLDESSLCDNEEHAKYMTMVGALQWAVSPGQINIITSVMMMSRFRIAPRRAHLKCVQRIYQYLRNYKSMSIKFNTEMPDYSQFAVEQLDWGQHVYHPCKEDTPVGIPPEPTSKGKPVRMTTFFDVNLINDIITGRSCTGISHLLNKTPIDWLSKQKDTVETAMYGSEFVAGRIALDQIVDLRHTLWYLGVPLAGPLWLFGDNLSMINSSTVPGGKLVKRHNILLYHRMKEKQWQQAS